MDMLRRLLLVTLATAAAVALAGAAGSAKAVPLPTCASLQAWPDNGPLRCTDNDVAPQIWDDAADPWGTCDGFYIVATYMAQRTITDWGNHALVQVSFSGTLASSTNRSRVASYGGRFSKQIDYSTNPATIRRTGLMTHVFGPQGGLVLLTAGTEVFDSFHRGPNGDLGALCAALS